VEALASIGFVATIFGSSGLLTFGLAILFQLREPDLASNVSIFWASASTFGLGILAFVAAHRIARRSSAVTA